MNVSPANSIFETVKQCDEIKRSIYKSNSHVSNINSSNFKAAAAAAADKLS